MIKFDKQHEGFRMARSSLLIRFLKRVFRLWRYASQLTGSYTPTYRIVNIEQDEDDNYTVTIQLIGKNVVQTMAPEQLLADDKMVNQFSPTDIRALTYLGYLDMNAPQYKILAKQLSQNHDQTLFALKKRGEKQPDVLTADEISKNEDLIHGLSQKEAHMIGMTTANEQSVIEEKQKQQLREQLEKEDN